MTWFFETLGNYFQFPFVRYALIVGVLVALCSSLLGVTLVLKRFSFIGDGLSHVAFGGIAIASVLNLSNNMLLVLPVTVVSAILLLRTGKGARIKGDAAIAMISVGALALGYLIMNVFSTSANISGDVCSTLFGSTSILTLNSTEVVLCIILSIVVITIFILFYNKIFAVTFDESFSKASGVRTNAYNFLIAVVIAVIIVLAMNLVGSLLISALIIFPALSEAEKADIRLHDLAIIRNPYVIIGLVVLAVLIIIACTRVPKTQVEPEKANSTRQTLSNLWHNKLYREGVLTQMFYVAAQIMTWTFIIQYADNLGINKATAQTYNIVAMGLFLCGRFIATALMKYVNTSRLLAIFAACAALCAAGAILIVGKGGLYCLIGISAFMSLMFPTIYGIALENVDNQDASLGAAFLVEAIVGGAIMPPLQGMIIDKHEIFGHPAVNVSFILPLLCFVIVLCYGIRSYRLRRKAQITLN